MKKQPDQYENQIKQNPNTAVLRTYSCKMPKQYKPKNPEYKQTQQEVKSGVKTFTPRSHSLIYKLGKQEYNKLKSQKTATSQNLMMNSLESINTAKSENMVR